MGKLIPFPKRTERKPGSGPQVSGERAGTVTMLPTLERRRQMENAAAAADLFGYLRGAFGEMAPDFDEPLNCFCMVDPKP